MDPLTLGLLAATGLLFLTSRKGSHSQSVSAPSANPSGVPQQNANGANSLQDAASSLLPAGAVAGALLLSEASSRVAGAIGQTELASAVGRTGVPGVAAAGGAQLGKEFDRIFGGSGNEASGVVAQGTGGAIGFAAGMGSLVLLVPGLLQVGLLIWVAAVVISDIERLRRGQKGAVEDYWRTWNTAYAQAVAEIIRRKDSFPEYVRDKDLYAERLAIAFADGYAAEVNQQNFRAWMNRPKGVGMDAYKHAIYGRDRAYFAGNVVSNTPNVLRGTPLLRSDSSEYQGLIPDAEKV